MNWPTVIASVVAALLGGGGIAAIISAVSRQKVTKVEAADRLNESTLEWAAAVKADAADARRETADARREMAEMRLEMATVRREAEALAQELRQLRLAILDPFATLDSLRMLVNPGPGNGVHRSPVIPG
jgi:hypothetical protein